MFRGQVRNSYLMVSICFMKGKKKKKLDRSGFKSYDSMPISYS